MPWWKLAPFGPLLCPDGELFASLVYELPLLHGF